jgi:hypothetical protein
MKANGLIKPGPNTNQVWTSLYKEIEQVSRFSSLYHRLRSLHTLGLFLLHELGSLAAKRC